MLMKLSTPTAHCMYMDMCVYMMPFTYWVHVHAMKCMFFSLSNWSDWVCTVLEYILKRNINKNQSWPLHPVKYYVCLAVLLNVVVGLARLPPLGPWFEFCRGTTWIRFSVPTWLLGFFLEQCFMIISMNVITYCNHTWLHHRRQRHNKSYAISIYIKDRL